MPDLEDAIRHYGQDLLDRTDPISVDDLTSPRTSSPMEATPAHNPRIVLIAAAVLLAALIVSVALIRGTEDGRRVDTIDGPTTATTATTTALPTTAPPASSSTTVHAVGPADTVVAPSDLPVLVVNASGVLGAAGALTQTLRSAGYERAIEPEGAAPVIDGSTIVYYRVDASTDYGDEAMALAAVLGIGPDLVQPMGEDFGAGEFQPLDGVPVVVWLGPDLATPIFSTATTIQSAP